MSTTAFVMPNDLSDLCRVCLQLPEESQYLDLTTIYDEDDNLTYGECFTICTQIDLSVGEGVPHHLCKSCGLELQMSYDFHKKIEESKRVIEQCQKQIEEQKRNSLLLQANRNDTQNQRTNARDKREVVQLLNEKYVISDDDGDNDDDELAGTSQEMEDVSIMQTEFETQDQEEVETDEMDIINKICHIEDSTGQEIPPDKDNTISLEHMDEHEAEDADEMDDYQNLEALEDEGERSVTIPQAMSINNTDLHNFIHINRPDFCANVQRYVPPLTEETVIEEEISQDATDKWLFNLAGIETETEIKDTAQENKEKSLFKEKLTTKTSMNKNKEMLEVKSELKLKDTTIDALKFTVEEAPAEGLSANAKTSVCKICYKSFQSNNRLTWHMRMHDTNRKRFVCPVQICGRIYASKQACDLHYKQTHLDEGFICLTCHKVFSAKQTLEVHMRYHTKEYPYQCNLCERKFAQKGHLTQHIEVKHQNLRYICTEPDCGKIFQNSVSLRNHAYTHSSMPFKCNRCGKEYPQKNKLRAHLMQKHKLDYSLDDLESMRQFNIIRTRHAYVKVQTVALEESLNEDSEGT